MGRACSVDLRALVVDVFDRSGIAGKEARRILLGRTLLVLLLAVPHAGVCEATVAGKTAKEMFPDAEVAKLAAAASRGDVDEVDRLVKAGVPVDGLGADDATPLTFAMLTPNVRGMEALLARGADPNHCIKSNKNAEGRVPIILLVTSRSTPDLLEPLLRHGADPNTREPVKSASFPYRGRSLLIRSVGSLESVKVLVQYGADVNLRPQLQPYVKGGDSAAVEAAWLGQFDAVDFLVEHGADDLDEIAHTLQSRSWGAAARPRRLETLRKLRDRGAHIYAAVRVPGHEPVSYEPQDTPKEWLSPGYYTPRPDPTEPTVRLH